MSLFCVSVKKKNHFQLTYDLPSILRDIPATEMLNVKKKKVLEMIEQSVFIFRMSGEEGGSERVSGLLKVTQSGMQGQLLPLIPKSRFFLQNTSVFYPPNSTFQTSKSLKPGFKNKSNQSWDNFNDYQFVLSFSSIAQRHIAYDCNSIVRLNQPTRHWRRKCSQKKSSLPWYTHTVFFSMAMQITPQNYKEAAAEVQETKKINRQSLKECFYSIEKISP